MVRALLDGSKTQTRRVVKMPPSWDCFVCADWGDGWWPYRSDDGESPTYDNNEIRLNCPYGQPGDRLWVRETWSIQMLGAFGTDKGYDTTYALRHRADDGEREIHVAPGEADPYIKLHDSQRGEWRPSIHMPRWASRLLLEIVSVRVERLQDIATEEIEAEGVVTSDHDIMTHGCRARVNDFAKLWESINGEGSWGSNPWVWVVEFRRAEP